MSETFRVLKGAAKNIPSRAIILSRKAQMFLMYHGDRMDEMVRMSQLRDEYISRRDSESINRITAAEIENCIRYGLKLEDVKANRKKNHVPG
jgi:hypothetical protein